MKKLNVFTVVIAMALIVSGIFYACKKDEIVQNEIVLKKQHKLTDFVPFIIVTEDEMQYLENPESIEEFKVNVSSYIDVAVELMDCYFVFYIEREDDMVQNAVLGKNPTSSSPRALWSNRLHGYFEIAKTYPVVEEYNLDDFPLPDGACRNFSKKKDAKYFAGLLMDREEISMVCVSKGTLDGKVIWTVCWEYE